MFIKLPIEIITKIIFYLENKQIYDIILTHKILLNQKYQLFMIPQFIKKNMLAEYENVNQLFNNIRELKTLYDYSLGDYLNDLLDIVESDIYYKNRYRNYSIFNLRFKKQKTINFTYNNINFINKKPISNIKIHDTYRVNMFTYIQLKKFNPNVLALIY